MSGPFNPAMHAAFRDETLSCGLAIRLVISRSRVRLLVPAPYSKPRNAGLCLFCQTQSLALRAACFVLDLRAAATHPQAVEPANERLIPCRYAHRIVTLCTAPPSRPGQKGTLRAKYWSKLIFSRCWLEICPICASLVRSAVQLEAVERRSGVIWQRI